MSSHFLPISQADLAQRGWDCVDIIIVTGDAYVDHPSFGAAMIGRVLEHEGYRVGIIAVPDWKDPASITVLGRPRLFFGVTSGNVDSMLAHFTAFKKRRSDDPYAPGGVAGMKPERAVIVYCNLIRAAYKGVPVVIGGIEASMRRLAHYDFWSNSVRRSILEDSRADILAYGMAEQAVAEIARRIEDNTPLDNIPGTVIASSVHPGDALLLPSEESVLSSQKVFVDFYGKLYRNRNKILAQPAAKRFLVHYPPPADMSTARLDALYELPFTREQHSSYDKPVPAFEMINASVNSHRGCFSGCSFCSLSLHQGKRIISRSKDSILKEVHAIARKKGFKGHITDIGGPTANMYAFTCVQNWKCDRESCTFPSLCANLVFGTTEWLSLLAKAKKEKNVKHVTVGSGIRYDLFMQDPAHERLLQELAASHVSGQLKIAPEHTNDTVLAAMRKKPLHGLAEFKKAFAIASQRAGKKQFLLPYLMSCHPGCAIPDMVNLKKEVLDIFGFLPDQVQAFIPLPMTLSSVQYYAGIDPLTGKHYKVATGENERKAQHDTILKHSHKPFAIIEKRKRRAWSKR